MQQYFIRGLQADKFVTIEDKDTVKHMFQVMRLREDDEVVLVFDDGVKYLSKIVDSQTHEVEILKALDNQTELPVSVTVASAFPKGDKLEFIAQKVTELGASALWSFPSDWAVAKWDGKKLKKKGQKLEKIVLGAAEQSKRNGIPSVELFEKQADFLGRFEEFDHILIAYEESAKEGEQAKLVQSISGWQEGDKVLLVFGPEGGISPNEIEKFQSKGGVCVGLGPRIMRAETAPLYALSAISYAMELTR